MRFTVQVYDRAADVADWLIMRSVGEMIQMSTWKSIVRSVVGESGGELPDGLQKDVAALDEEQAARVEEWLQRLVLARKRAEAPTVGQHG